MGRPWLLVLAATVGCVAALETKFDGMEWDGYVFTVLIGVGVGFVGGYCGIGGAPFMVAFVRLLLEYCQHTAQGTVVTVMMPPMSMFGVYVMKDRALRVWKVAMPAVVGYAIFSFFGALLAFQVEAGSLSYVFGVFLILVGARYGKQFVLRQLSRSRVTESAVQPSSLDVEKSSTTDEDAKPAALARRDSVGLPEITEWGVEVYPGSWPFNYKTSAIVGCFIGLVGGFFGIGAGVLKVPIFTELFGITKDDARTLSLVILLPPVSIGAVIKYAYEDDIDWYMSLALLLLYMCSNYPGAKSGLKASTAVFKMVMGMLLAVLGTFIIVNQKYWTGDEFCDKDA